LLILKNCHLDRSVSHPFAEAIVEGRDLALRPHIRTVKTALRCVVVVPARRGNHAHGTEPWTIRTTHGSGVRACPRKQTSAQPPAQYQPARQASAARAFELNPGAKAQKQGPSSRWAWLRCPSCAFSGIGCPEQCLPLCDRLLGEFMVPCLMHQILAPTAGSRPIR